MKRLLLSALLILGFSGIVHAQGVRYFSQVLQQGTVATATNVVTIPANPIVSFCNSPANAVPCSNRATTYTDSTLNTACPTSTQIVLDGTSNCVASPDNQGNWGVWIAPGQYQYTITINGVGNFGPFSVTTGGILSVSGTANQIVCTSGSAPACGLANPLIFPGPTESFSDEGSQTYDVTAYGAKCDGSTDDTTAIQDTYNLLTSKNGGKIRFPTGASGCVVTNTITLSNAQSVQVQGGKILWKGTSTSTPVLSYVNDRNVLTQGMYITPLSYTSYPIGTAIDIRENNTSGYGISSGNIFNGNVIEGTGSGGLNIGFEMVEGTAGDQNNDEMKFYGNECRNYTEACFQVDHPQSTDHLFLGNQGYPGVATGNYYLDSHLGGVVTVEGGFDGGASVSVFYLGENASHTNTISGFNSESGNRFAIIGGGGFTGPLPTVLLNNRFGADHLDSDGNMVIYNSPGPLEVIGGNYGLGFAGSCSSPPKIVYSGGSAFNFGKVEGVAWDDGCTDAAHVFISNTNYVQVGENLCTDSGNVAQLCGATSRFAYDQPFTFSWPGNHTDFLLNTTAATSMVSQNSPVLSQCGTGYTAGASTPDCATFQHVVNSGTDAGWIDEYGHSGAGGSGQFSYPGAGLFDSQTLPSEFGLILNTYNQGVSGSNFAIAGWAMGDALGTITGDDQDFSFTVTTSTNMESPNPTVTYTFVGTPPWPNVPTCGVMGSIGTSTPTILTASVPQTWVRTAVSKTAVTFTLIGTPGTSTAFGAAVHCGGR